MQIENYQLLINEISFNCVFTWNQGWWMFESLQKLCKANARLKNYYF